MWDKRVDGAQNIRFDIRAGGDVFSRQNSLQSVATQPFQQSLKHTQFKIWSLQEILFARIADSTNSTTRCNMYVKERVSRQNSLQSVASQPFQQSLYYTHFKIWSLLKIIVSNE